MMNPQFFFAFLFCFLFQLASLSGQARLYEAEKSRYRFAQLYVGLNTQWVPGGGELYAQDAAQAFPEMLIPRLTFGGLHFWGKLDFKMSFALTHLGDLRLEEDTELEFRPGGDFSARYYFWRIRDHHLRPYAGLSFSQMFVGLDRQEQGDRQDFFPTVGGIAGVSFAHKGWQWNAEVMGLPWRKMTFYPNRQEARIFQLPAAYFSLGMVRYFDTTLKEEKRKKTGETQAIERQLRKEGKLNTLSVGIAPSAAYFLRSPRYERMERQSVPRHSVNFTWEMGLGYLWAKPGVHLGLSYRDYTSGRESYGLDHLIRRRSLAVEGYKFLWDFHGFVPFVGPSISWERWATAEFEGNTRLGDIQFSQMVSPGLIFGWDISTSPVDTWLLRTNLRYYPFQRINDLAGNRSWVDQFEFNFIQLVIYPQRIYHVRRARKAWKNR